MHAFEYKFLRLEQDRDWFVGEKLSKSTLSGYQEIAQKHASDGWRLVQIFAPGIGTAGQPPYFELILERLKPESAS